MSISTSSQNTISLYKSRQTIIQLLKSLNFNVEDYENFSINEIDAMNRNEQMDMLIYHKKRGVFITHGKNVFNKHSKQNCNNYSAYSEVFQHWNILNNDS